MQPSVIDLEYALIKYNKVCSSPKRVCHQCYVSLITCLFYSQVSVASWVRFIQKGSFRLKVLIDFHVEKRI
jgi:hypothetical protein